MALSASCALDWSIYSANSTIKFCNNKVRKSVRFFPCLDTILHPPKACSGMNISFADIYNLCLWLSLNDGSDQFLVLQKYQRSKKESYLRIVLPCSLASKMDKVSASNEKVVALAL